MEVQREDEVSLEDRLDAANIELVLVRFAELRAKTRPALDDAGLAALLARVRVALRPGR